MPGDLATTQATLEGISDVGVLAWTGAKAFKDDHLVEIHSLEVPQNQLHIDIQQYHLAKEILDGYDIVHIHHNHSGFYAKLIAHRLGLPIITTEHNNHDGFTQKGRIANGLTNPLADRIICVSESVRASFKAWENALISEKAVDVIYNGVDMDRLKEAQHLEWGVHDIADIDENATVVGSAGRLVDQKGYDVLIEGIDRLNQIRDNPVELVISGKGEKQAELENLISTSEYPDRLHLLGFLDRREKVFKMMDECDIFAMPSRWEGYCISVMEAMAQGTPCILSGIDVFREVYDEAAVFHPVDDVSALTDNVSRLIDDPELREECIQKGVELSCSHTFQETAKEYKETYVDVLTR